MTILTILYFGVLYPLSFSIPGHFFLQRCCYNSFTQAAAPGSVFPLRQPCSLSRLSPFAVVQGQDGEQRSLVEAPGQDGMHGSLSNPNLHTTARVAMKIPLTLSQGTHQLPDSREAHLRAMGTGGALPHCLGFCAAKWLPCRRAKKEHHEGDGDSRQGFLLIQCCFL